MTWVVFADRPAFDAYNLAACGAHTVPRPGYRQSDQSPRILNQWTQAWADTFGAFTAPPNSYILVTVPDVDVATYSLTVAQNPPVVNLVTRQRTIVWDGVSRTIFNTAPVTLQPKPATWTDPHTGITYNTTTGLPV